MTFPESLKKKLAQREAHGALRSLSQLTLAHDFSSNDYLGLARNPSILQATDHYLKQYYPSQNGATGSRLLSGNHPLHEQLEAHIAHFHQAESALLFNSGYDANVGIFSSLPQRGDIVLYDALCHASIRDGLSISHASSYKFAHNDCHDLEKKIRHLQKQKQEQNQEQKNQNTSPENPYHIYIAIESVYSMDGDCAPLEALCALCEKYGCWLIVDEAHALGVYGNHGEGLVQSLGLQDRPLVRLMTFGKGLGCHGAAVLGSQTLRAYLINFARSFIYTTALPLHGVAQILQAYHYLLQNPDTQNLLRANIHLFRDHIAKNHLTSYFIPSDSAIHCAVIGDIQQTKHLANALQQQGFDVRAILSPTVAIGGERLRFCLHSYNTEIEIREILQTMAHVLTELTESHSNLIPTKDTSILAHDEK